MVKVFESIYWNGNKYRKSLSRLISKEYKGHEVEENVLFLPYRLINYRVGNKSRKMLVNIISFINIDESLNLIFTIRNDYLKLKSYERDLEEIILDDSDISNHDIVNRFISLINHLDKLVNELKGSKYSYVKHLARFDLNRIILGPLQDKKSIVEVESKAGEVMKYEFLKSILEDALGFKKNEVSIEDEINIFYMPTLFILEEGDIHIYELTGKKIRLNKNLTYIYKHEKRFREWIKNKLV